MVHHPWVLRDQIHVAPDPEKHPFEAFNPLSVAEADHLAIVCHSSRAADVRRVLELMELDPFPCEDGQEWARFMQMWLHVPDGA